MSYSERELLARIIQCEAGGEGDNGMKAVATVVLNRVNVPIGECLWYLNPFKPTCGSTFPSNGSGTLHTRLGKHCFYKPTELYSNT